MESNATKNNKKSQKLLHAIYALTGSTAFLGLLFAYFVVLEYDMPKKALENPEYAKEVLKAYEDSYDISYDMTLDKAKDSLNRNKQYKKLARSLFEMKENQQTNTNKYKKAEERLYDLHSEIYNYFLENDEMLKEARAAYSKQHNLVEEIEKDIATWDSIRQQPLKERMTRNWKQLRIDWHSWQKDKHIAKLNALQKQR